ncbi:hypothetical protein [Amedibacillus sp. YH-ame10]
MKKTYIIQGMIFFLLIVIFLYGFQTADIGMSKEDGKRAEEAIQKAARECYSIEGAYPKDIAYLKKHYGLFIQEDKYMIRYKYIASNIMPEMDVYPKGRGE